MKKGKIKFSRLKNNRGVSTDYFRICHNAKNKSGDWQEIGGFPIENDEMEFYFPFSKMENNIQIAYTGYTNLPTNGKNSREDSYFVVSNGVGSPIVATPQGHNGRTYGVKDNILLTEAHLKKWRMVKKRMSVNITPITWAPNEFVSWSTTSEIAIDTITGSYMELVAMFGTDLSLIPLSFKSFAISGKTSTGTNYRNFIGSIGAKRGLNGLREGLLKAREYRELFNIREIEDQFERAGYFFHDDNDDVDSTTDIVDPETGEVTTVENKEGAKHNAPLDYGEALLGIVPEKQAKKIVQLSLELGKEEEIRNISNTSQALSFLNALQSQKNAA